MKKMNIQNDLNSRKEIAKLSITTKSTKIIEKPLTPVKDAESEIVQEYPVDENSKGPETQKAKTGRKTQRNV